MDNLTDFQKAQLLTLHMTGSFAYKTSSGTKVPRPAWRKMISALLVSGAIDDGCRVTPAGRAWLDANHMNIILSVL